MTSKNAKEIKASPEKVYNAFIDPRALEQWQAPYGMTGRVHDFDASEGGGYTMSLYYDDTAIAGKTTANEDRFSVRFVKLQPYRKIIQAVTFQSDDAQFHGEMIMEIYMEMMDTLTTRLTMFFKNIPAGINPADNEKGTEQSLEKLARYVERH